VRDHGAAEIAVQHARDIAAILDQQRLVEAEFPAQLLVPHRIDAALARHGLDRIAGDEPDEKKCHHRDPEEGRDHQADTREREANHAAAARPSPHRQDAHPSLTA
jgi:hypothetical protein